MIQLWHLQVSLFKWKRIWGEAASGYTVSKEFKGWCRCKKVDGRAITIIAKENAIKKTFDKRFAVPLYLSFFKHPVYPYGVKENLIVRPDLNSSEKVILCSGDTTAT